MDDEEAPTPDLSDLETIVDEQAELAVNASTSNGISTESMAHQLVKAFNLTAHIFYSIGPRADPVPQFDCPPDYLYYGGGDSPNGIDLAGGKDEPDLSSANVGGFFGDISGGAGGGAGGGAPRYDILRYAINVYIVSSLCAFGFVGNMLSIVVLRRDRLTGGRDVQNACTSCLLQALAALNTVHLAACLVIQPAKTVIELSPRLLPRSVHRGFAYVEPHAWVLASIAQTASVWMLVVVTADRYVAVCRPLKSHLRTLSRAKSAVLAVIALSVVYNTPSFFERRTVELDCAGDRVAVVRQTALRSHYIYFVVYKTVLFFVFRTAGPLAGLTALNVRLLVALRELRKRRRRLKVKCSTIRARRRETVTVLLIAVVTMFLACELPDLTLRIAATVIGFRSQTQLDDDGEDISTFDEHFDGSEEFDEELALRCVNVVSNCLLTANSALSFVVYCTVVRKFRVTLVAICQCGAANGDGITGKTSMPDVSEADQFAVIGECVANVHREPEVAVATVVEVVSYVKADVVTTSRVYGSIEIEAEDCG